MHFVTRLSAACDFWIVGLERERLVEWILEQNSPFDSLYYYGRFDRAAEDSEVFLREDAPVRLGVGKNMVRSIDPLLVSGIQAAVG
jgi:Protein of unknown function (DUF4007)